MEQEALSRLGLGKGPQSEAKPPVQPAPLWKEAVWGVPTLPTLPGLGRAAQAAGAGGRGWRVFRSSAGLAEWEHSVGIRT